MTLDLELLQEGWDFEAKLATGQDGKGRLPQSFWETYSAMANTHGGVVVLGVKEESDGRLVVHGLAAVDKIENDLWTMLANPEKVNCNLLDRSSVERQEIDGKTVLVLRIPRADRRQRPVFINNNPLRGTFVRTHEGDRRASETTVRRMLADAGEQPRDGEILEHFGLDDLETDSIAAYRNLFRSNYPNHPFLAGDDRDMLRQLGGWARDRANGWEGITLAGLLMFGRQRSILDRLPHFQLDYRHLPPSATPGTPRWLDRVTLDGTWSGNLFDFFRKVISKLRDGLSVPFLLGPDLFRRDESPQHEALREAMVNALIHADYLASGGVRIFRLSNGFEFNNPGLLRLPAEQIRAGGKSDCRNPSLQQMFQMIGAGEKAGSGFPKILQAWREQHWRAPALEENTEQEEVCLRLPTISLFPPEVTEEMERRFPKRLARLDETGRLAIATAILEGRVSNERLQELTDKHPRDIAFLLKRLVEERFLVGNDKRRWSSYALVPISPASGLVDAQHKEESSPHKDPSSPHKEESSPHKNPSSPHNGASPAVVEEVRKHKRSAPDKVEAAILVVCTDQFVMAEELADKLQRGMKSLKNNYISKMIRDGRLELRYPGQPTHPQQAYRAKVVGQ
jgi:predicted HTH transcriptional regulator